MDGIQKHFDRQRVRAEIIVIAIKNTTGIDFIAFNDCLLEFNVCHTFSSGIPHRDAVNQESRANQIPAAVHLVVHRCGVCLSVHGFDIQRVSFVSVAIHNNICLVQRVFPKEITASEKMDIVIFVNQKKTVEPPTIIAKWKGNKINIVPTFISIQLNTVEVEPVSIQIKSDKIGRVFTNCKNVVGGGNECVEKIEPGSWA
ncbi:MAG: hypothetical protein IJ524_05710 [Bacteroidales bacterium]|nr:hypothetical protein [Bacteroidales bacterium]